MIGLRGFFLFFVVVLIAIISPGNAAIWHLAPDGDDLAGDGTEEHPYKTLPVVLLKSEIHSGDTVLLAGPGLYSYHEVSVQKPVTISGYPGRPTISTGNSGFFHNAFTLSSDTILDNLDITGSYTGVILNTGLTSVRLSNMSIHGNTYRGISCGLFGQFSNVSLHNCTLEDQVNNDGFYGTGITNLSVYQLFVSRNGRGGISLENCRLVTFADGNISDNRAGSPSLAGLYLNNVSDSIFSGLVISGNAGGGVDLRNGKNITFSNSTLIQQPPLSELSVRSDCSGITLRNITFSENPHLSVTMVNLSGQFIVNNSPSRVPSCPSSYLSLNPPHLFNMSRGSSMAFDTLSFHYTDDELPSGIDENGMKIWRLDEGSWKMVNGTQNSSLDLVAFNETTDLMPGDHLYSLMIQNVTAQAPPQIQGMYPDHCFRDEIVQEVNITGSGYSGGEVVSFTRPGGIEYSFPAGLNGPNLTLTSFDTHDMAPGSYDIRVCSLATGLCSSRQGAFTIFDRPVIPAPRVISFSPDHGFWGETITRFSVVCENVYGGELINLTRSGYPNISTVGTLNGPSILVTALDLREMPVGIWNVWIGNQSTGMGGMGHETFEVRDSPPGPDCFYIRTSADEHGFVMPSGDLPVHTGDSIGIRIGAKPGYLIDDVTIDGISAGPLSFVVFSSVHEDHVLSVRTCDDPRSGPVTFSADPRAGTAPLTVHFYGPDGGGAGYWNWRFGDGSVSQERNPVHTYLEPGSYTVELRNFNGNVANGMVKWSHIEVF